MRANRNPVYLITLTFYDDLTGRQNTRRTVRDTEEAARASARNLLQYYEELPRVSGVELIIQEMAPAGKTILY